eukprot:431518-Hanusia_phi.AAC.1
MSEGQCETDLFDMALRQARWRSNCMVVLSRGAAARPAGTGARPGGGSRCAGRGGAGAEAPQPQSETVRSDGRTGGPAGAGCQEAS